jgi:hypothetical protein
MDKSHSKKPITGRGYKASLKEPTPERGRVGQVPLKKPV